MSTTSRGLRPFQPIRFGRYTLLTPIATGGMGAVYLARMASVEGFEKLVVIKKILPALAQEKAFVERFVDEAKILVKLQHGSIAQVLDMGVEDGEYYIAMEFVDGKDLRKVAARARDNQQPFPAGLALYVTVRVLDALAYAHRKKDSEDRELNLVHRDISPQNVLVSYEGEVKVIDFGLAKSAMSLGRTSPSVVLGKFFYMSPEAARHQQVDRRADLYAAGICLWEMLAGRNPFDQVRPFEIMRVVANPSIPPIRQVRPELPESLETVLAKALAVNPDERFASAEEMRGRLTSVMLEVDPAAGPESLAAFMRAQFAREHESERKAMASLARLSVKESEDDEDDDEGGEGVTESIEPGTVTFPDDPPGRPGISGIDVTAAPPVEKPRQATPVPAARRRTPTPAPSPARPSLRSEPRRRTRESAPAVTPIDSPTPVRASVIGDPPTPVRRQSFPEPSAPDEKPAEEKPAARHAAEPVHSEPRTRKTGTFERTTKRLPTQEQPASGSSKRTVLIVLGLLGLLGGGGAALYFSNAPASPSALGPRPDQLSAIEPPPGEVPPSLHTPPPAEADAGSALVEPKPDASVDPVPDEPIDVGVVALTVPDAGHAAEPEPESRPTKSLAARLSRRQRLQSRYQQLLAKDERLRKQYGCEVLGTTCRFRDSIVEQYQGLIRNPKKHDQLEGILDKWESVLDSRRRDIESQR